MNRRSFLGAGSSAAFLAVVPAAAQDPLKDGLPDSTGTEQRYSLPAPAKVKPIGRKLGDVADALDYMPRAELAAIKAGTSTYDATERLNAILADFRQVILPSGKLAIDTVGLTVPDETALLGIGDGQTTIQAKTSPVNMVRLKNWSQVKNLRLKGVYDFVAGGSGVLYQGSYSRTENVSVVDVGAQGFAYQGGKSNQNFQINTRAIHCGHRGINMSEGSYGNIVRGFMAEDCRLAGLLVGYASHDNEFSEVSLSGINENSLWVHQGCWRNMFDQVNIRDPADPSKALLYIGPSVRDSIFTNFILSGFGSGGCAVRLNNMEVDENLGGVVNGPIEGNLLDNFKIFGAGGPGSDGIRYSINHAQHIRDNAFESFYIDGCEDGVDGDAAGVSDNGYHSFRFGRVNRQFRGGSNATQYRTSRCFDFEGVTDVGSLALATHNLEAQPSFPASEVAVVNPYPFPVTIEISGLPPGGGIQVGGVNLKEGPTAGGDYSVRVPRGASIALAYSSGSPAWRWWSV